MDKKFKAVIFDMDGLTLDTERLSYLFWQKIFPEYGFEFRDEVYLKVLGSTVEDTKRIFEEAYGCHFPYVEMRKRRIAEVDKYVLENGLPTRDGLVELLDFLESNNIPKAIGTSTARDMAISKLKHAKVYSRFPILVGGDEVITGKPSPDIFLKVAQKLDVLPEQCIVLEDSCAGIEAAYRANMLPILVPDLQIPTEEIKEKAHAICGSLYEVRELLSTLLL